MTDTAIIEAPNWKPSICIQSDDLPPHMFPLGVSREEYLELTLRGRNRGKKYAKRKPKPSDREGWRIWPDEDTWDILEANGLLSLPIRVWRRWAKRAKGSGYAENTLAIQQEIAADAGCSFSSVWNATKVLVGIGLLEPATFKKDKRERTGFRVKGYRMPKQKPKGS